MIPLGPVVARGRARAPRAAVWAYFVDSELRKEWWPELRLDPRVGGAVAEQWTEADEGSAVSRDASGDVDVWVDGHAIGFRWSDAGDQYSTAVLVTLRSRGADTGITVTETGFDVLPDAAERAAASQEGWQVLLADLVDSVEAAVAAGAFAEEEAAAEGEAEDEGAEGVTPALEDDTAEIPDAAEAGQDELESGEAEAGEPEQALQEASTDTDELLEVEAAEISADTTPVTEIAAAEAPVEEAPVEEARIEESQASESSPVEAPAAEPDPEDLAFAELGFGDLADEEIADEHDPENGDSDSADEPNFDDLIRGSQKD
ncbi:SRPBCC domain-containing protein [Leucobacter insecticola]|uniref:SRPBCC domain-containing protein n=1 Tax=Leucobacter insecticola TaxID=2714934 RepID=A0A6G8FFL2_9MICO|nr:SRPBCC domain-containing protein [Leucobacter insecticola]QIM15256.1 SRPBCC domain-containing protein [Leucobacter insecticola]